MKKITLLFIFLLVSSITLAQADYAEAGNGATITIDAGANDNAGTAYPGGTLRFFDPNVTTSKSQYAFDNSLADNITLLGSGQVQYSAPAGFSGEDTFSYKYYTGGPSGPWTEIVSSEIQVTVYVCPADASGLTTSASGSQNGTKVEYVITAPTGYTVSYTIDGTSSGTAVNGDTVDLTKDPLTSGTSSIVLNSIYRTNNGGCTFTLGGAGNTYSTTWCNAPASGDISVSASQQNGTNVEFTIAAPAGVTVAYTVNGSTSGTATNGQTVTVLHAAYTSGTDSIVLDSAYLTSDNTCTTTLGGAGNTYTQAWCNAPAPSGDITMLSFIQNGTNTEFTVVAPVGVTVAYTINGSTSGTATNGQTITVSHAALTSGTDSVVLDSAYLTSDNTCSTTLGGAGNTYSATWCNAPASGDISVSASQQNGTDVEFTIAAPAGVTVAYTVNGSTTGTATNGQTVTVSHAALTSGNDSMVLDSAYLTSDNTCSTTLGGAPFTYSQTWCNPPAESDVSASAAVVGDDVVFTFNMSANVTATVNMVSNGSTQSSGLSVTNGTTYTFVGGNLVHSIDLEAVFTDAHLTSSPACNTNLSPDKTITFTVPRSNHPLAIDDVYPLDQTKSREISPLTRGTNDSDPNNLALSIKSINGVAIAGGVQTIPLANADINIDANNVITFVPYVVFAGTIQFPYVIQNTNGYEDDGVVTVNIAPLPNQPTTPTAVADSYIMPQDTTIEIEPLTKGTDDSDPNDLDIIILSIGGTNLTGGVQSIAVTNGTVDIDVNGDITFTPTTSYNGTVTIPYVIQNILGDTATADVTIVVDAVTASPTAPTATDDNYTVDQYDTVQLRPLTKGTNDSDPNDLDLTVYSIAGEVIDYNNLPYTIPNFTGGTLVVNSADDIDFTPSAATTPVTIQYVITNDGNAPGAGNSDTANQIIVVTPVAAGPSNPVATDDNYTADQNETIQLRPLTKGTNDSDPNNQALTIYSIAGEEIDYNNLPYTIPNFTGGTLVVNAADDIDFTPTAATTPVTIPYVIVNDGNAPSGTNDATANQIIVVTPVAAGPTSPTATDDNYSIEAGETVQLRPLTKGTNDSDPNGLALTITHIAGEEINYNALPYTIPGFATGTIVVNGADDIDFTPSLDNVTYTIPYTIKNTNNETASANEVIIVAPAKVVATAPVAVDDVYSMVQNTTRELYPLTRGVNDSDPNGDPLSITKINNEAITGGVQTIIVPNGIVSIDASDVITFAPTSNFTGTIVFSYEITDGNGNFDVGTQTINVLVSRTDTTGINDEINIIDDKFTVYPNPSNGNMVVFLTSEKEGTAKIILSDMSGRVIYSRDTNVREGQNEIDMTFNVSRGVKFLQVVTPTQKLVKRVIFR